MRREKLAMQKEYNAEKPPLAPVSSLVNNKETSYHMETVAK